LASGAGIRAAEGEYLFVAAGSNEAAVWGLPQGGECLKCFRTVPLDSSRDPIAPLPELQAVPLPSHPNGLLPSALSDLLQRREAARPHQVRTMLGRISLNNSSYVVTAGTDRAIRFWDFSSPSKCFTVTGLEAAQPKPIFDAPKIPSGSGNLFMCYVPETPSTDRLLQAHLPIKEGRGLNTAPASFKDAVLDLKSIDLPMRLMISCSRDGEIKLWR